MFRLQLHFLVSQSTVKNFYSLGSDGWINRFMFSFFSLQELVSAKNPKDTWKLRDSRLTIARLQIVTHLGKKWREGDGNLAHKASTFSGPSKVSKPSYSTVAGSRFLKPFALVHAFLLLTGSLIKRSLASFQHMLMIGYPTYIMYEDKTT